MGALPLMLCCLLHLMRFGFSIENTTEYAEPEYLDMLLKTGQYEEFSKLLQIDNVDLVRPNDGNGSPDPMFSKGMEHGDILLRPWQLEESRQGLRFTRFPTAKWPNRRVPYSISMRGYTRVQYMEIKNAINNWNYKIKQIQFVPRKLSDKDYVLFFNGNGCYSNLGKVGGQQPISIQKNGCTRTGTIQHEMMHAIGFSHEQNRPDRDDYIKILWDNIPNDWKSQYEKTTSEDFELLAPYDYYSIMHYPIPAPDTNPPKPAFEVLKKNVDLARIGQRVKMTPSDEMKIKKLYA